MSYGDEHDRPGYLDVVDTGRVPRRRRGQLLLLLGVALVGLAGGAGFAYAAEHSGHTVASDSPSVSQPGASAASPAASPPPWQGRNFRGGPGFGRFGGFGGLGAFGGLGGFGGAIHGQLTEPKSGGGYQTIDVQRGTVTAVSSTSITVKSADGYTASYLVTSSTEVDAQAAGIGTVKVGDTVSLVATVSDGRATAASITDATAIRASHGAFGFPSPPPANNPS
jgi:hypothetical protein